MVRVAVIGASGYTGLESIRIISGHPAANLSYLTALPQECGAVGEIFPQFAGRCDLEIEPLDMAKLSGLCDVVLCCLPHKVSMGFVPRLLEAGVKVIDFSADYRLKNTAVYESFYKVEHTDTENLEHAVFGLPELYRGEIKDAELVANPGCFPTAFILGVAPVLKRGLIKPETIIVNAVTSPSGAGRKPNELFHFPNMNENLFAYAVGTHRHTPEMEQLVKWVGGSEGKVLFQPHAGPFDRGILATIYCELIEDLSGKELVELYGDFYRDQPFVRVRSKPPAVKEVAGSNYCDVFPTIAGGKLVVFSAIDNLVKGASGQAVQNMNIVFGLEESLGLK